MTAAGNDWIEWNGGECPVSGDVVVEYKMRPYGNDNVNTDAAGDLRWVHLGYASDITAYRVVVDSLADLCAADEVPPSALATQVGGDHYKGATIQPVEFCVKNKMESLESNIVKRAFRHDKPTGKGREDVEKIIHEAQLLLELKYGVAA